MKRSVAPDADKIRETDEAPEPGYAAWKKRKIERGLEQARNRDSLIPADEVWRKLGLER